MQPEVRRKIDEYIANAYRVEEQKIREAMQQKMAELPPLGRGNSGYSKYADQRFVRLYAERASACALAMAKVMIDAYELYDAELDGVTILTAATRVRDETVAGMWSAASGEMQLRAMRTRTVGNGEHDKAVAASFKQQLTVQTHHVGSEITCLIEQRKVMPKYRKPQPEVQVFQQGATNPKVVVGIDQSINTFNDHRVFNQLRDIIAANVAAPVQGELLGRLEALEKEVGNPKTFHERWIEFRSAAADYWGFIAPFVPAIQDVLHRHGVLT